MPASFKVVAGTGRSSTTCNSNLSDVIVSRFFKWYTGVLGPSRKLPEAFKLSFPISKHALPL